MPHYTTAAMRKPALLLAGAWLTAACVAPTGPASADPTSAEKDLQTLAAKVRYFNPPSAQKAEGKNPNGGGFEKASARAGNACDQEGESIEEGTDTTEYGASESYQDTTRSYTAAGALVCGLEDAAAYTTLGHHAKDTQSESWMHTRADFSPDPAVADWILKLSGSGKAAYAGGYTLEMKSVEIILGYSGVTVFDMDLGLEGGYTAHLALAPGKGAETVSAPSAAQVILSGPILKDGVQVGALELRGDDSVIVRDAAGQVVPVLAIE